LQDRIDDVLKEAEGLWNHPNILFNRSN
jgi:hypothetical protein